MENYKLNPCPFCGSNDITYYNGWIKGSGEKDISLGRVPEITCGGCNCGFSFGYFGRGISDGMAEKMTVEKWNSRNKRNNTKLEK